ncbi:uncharacterized protein ColSpa_10467 [Colletotrichum spaethianum]|uniref:Uncharacterized protein n=1 Tax=Colletotrichum spaethianum TaxID=700344 RepID=A0AA37PDI1_9PEZI|nr:uncharacterized protein ColSpa_10467 [Colletotrichum spaethianum]GKT50286.1 hypothetical protein ColSpa_10467 [Colletotrichum spaethianum]
MFVFLAEPALISEETLAKRPGVRPCLVQYLLDDGEHELGSQLTEGLLRLEFNGELLLLSKTLVFILLVVGVIIIHGLFVFGRLVENLLCPLGKAPLNTVVNGDELRQELGLELMCKPRELLVVGVSARLFRPVTQGTEEDVNIAKSTSGENANFVNYSSRRQSLDQTRVVLFAQDGDSVHNGVRDFGFALDELLKAPHLPHEVELNALDCKGRDLIFQVINFAGFIESAPTDNVDQDIDRGRH